MDHFHKNLMTQEFRKKRQFRNMLVRPRRQIRIMFLTLSSGLLTLALLTGYYMYYHVVLVTALRERDPTSAVLLENFTAPMFRNLIIGQAALWIFSMVFGLAITHRIYGPMVAILRHIKRLSDGDLSSRVKLRDKDELDEMASALNELAATLEEKYGNP